MNIRQATAALLMTVLSFAFVDAARAQSDDTDQHEAERPAAAKPLVDQINHHHGTGGDDAAARSSLRPDPADIPSVRGGRPEVTGLAQNHASLPGELGESPEAGPPLFARPPAGLAMRPDPWTVPDK
jgi:hypothetical protein